MLTSTNFRRGRTCVFLLHTHLVNYPPKIAISSLVNSLKGVSSRLIRKKNYPSIQKALWGNSLWSPSYFAKKLWQCAFGNCKAIHSTTTIFRKNINILAPLYPIHKWMGFNGVI
jgi:hypothetical protein